MAPNCLRRFLKHATDKNHPGGCCNIETGETIDLDGFTMPTPRAKGGWVMQQVHDSDAKCRLKGWTELNMSSKFTSAAASSPVAGATVKSKRRKWLPCCPKLFRNTIKLQCHLIIPDENGSCKRCEEECGSINVDAEHKTKDGVPTGEHVGFWEPDKSRNCLGCDMDALLLLVGPSYYCFNNFMKLMVYAF